MHKSDIKSALCPNSFVPHTCSLIITDERIMSKFRIRMKLTGLELEIEGTRDDVPLITHSLGNQLSGLLRSPAEIIETDTEAVAAKPQEVTATVSKARKPKPAKRKLGADQSGKTVGPVALDWRHDPAKWGVPRQSWTAAKKIVYLLYVAGNEAGIKDLSGGSIVATFNKHFRQSGMLSSKHIAQELGRLKNRPIALVSEDTTQTPSVWFLTQSGEKDASALVAEAMGHADENAPTTE